MMRGRLLTGQGGQGHETNPHNALVAHKIFTYICMLWSPTNENRWHLMTPVSRTPFLTYLFVGSKISFLQSSHHDVILDVTNHVVPLSGESFFLVEKYCALNNSDLIYLYLYWFALICILMCADLYWLYTDLSHQAVVFNWKCLNQKEGKDRF